MESITILQSLKITFLSMSIVFISLFVISQILELFKFVFYKKELETAATVAENNEYKEIKELDEELDLVAALTAAVLASNNQNNAKLRIKSIKRVA
ncbi:OadG family protein [Tepidibacter thalassicus]|uniref:Oxaloacetate decarboxylase, gamma chain n=1 Tax=Tepidibacter thalassicus DSM 15285 TaxID=1123350 RepID=A0A1M5TIM1_9FIRM|nr:OadG family protein [Tepidibacter thalassicus]SHH50612.1 Oxaloacetate decarboxylase, gamma chain [Tepidibacter thalassicus DSM 15285]